MTVPDTSQTSHGPVVVVSTLAVVVSCVVAANLPDQHGLRFAAVAAAVLVVSAVVAEWGVGAFAAGVAFVAYQGALVRSSGAGDLSMDVWMLAALSAMVGAGRILRGWLRPRRPSM